MGTNLFTDKSVQELATVHPKLVTVVIRARAWSRVAFEISQGARTIEQQREYFNKGASKVNPSSYATREALYKAAKHVVGPGEPLSRAVDVFVSGQEGGAYDKDALCYIAGVMDAAAKSLGVAIRWGGDFDRDGLLLEKGTFHDLPHFELDQP
jgi:peptidoglycan L-alanyl-D-glutamate endopeptidase CwlK